MISEVLIMHHVWIALYILPSGWLGWGGWLPASLQDFSGARACSLVPQFLFLKQRRKASDLASCQGLEVPPLATPPLFPTCICPALSSRKAPSTPAVTPQTLSQPHPPLRSCVQGVGRLPGHRGGSRLAHFCGPRGEALPCLWWSARSP